MKPKKFDLNAIVNLASVQNLGIVVSILFMLLRMVNLHADFPHGINFSGDLYTDEGWYSNNAIFYVRTGEWYIPGAFNPAVNFPIFTAMQIVMFYVFGVSFVTARLLTSAFSIGLTITLFFLVKKVFNRLAAVISILLLATNFYYFSYSRLALLEIPMTFFAMLSVYVLVNLDKKWQLKIFVSALFVGIAMLIKTSALFVIPVILYILLLKKNTYKIKLSQCGFFGFILCVFLTVYYIFFAQLHFQDYVYFSTLSIGSKLNVDLLRNLKDVIYSLLGLKDIDKSYVLMLLLFLNLVFLVKKSIKMQFIEKTAPFYIWFGICILLIALNHYFPPRYYVLPLFPCIILAGVSLEFLVTNYKRIYRNTALVLLAIYIGINSYSILHYINDYEYSLYNATRDIQSIIASNNGNSILFTDSPSVNLGLKNPVIEIRLGLEDVRSKISRYKPAFFLGFPSDIPEISEYCKIRLVKEFAVFHNYYTKEPLGLYNITY